MFSVFLQRWHLCVILLDWLKQLQLYRCSIKLLHLRYFELLELLKLLLWSIRLSFTSVLVAWGTEPQVVLHHCWASPKGSHRVPLRSHKRICLIVSSHHVSPLHGPHVWWNLPILNGSSVFWIEIEGNANLAMAFLRCLRDITSHNFTSTGSWQSDENIWK